MSGSVSWEVKHTQNKEKPKLHLIVDAEFGACVESGVKLQSCSNTCSLGNEKSKRSKIHPKVDDESYNSESTISPAECA